MIFILATRARNNYGNSSSRRGITNYGLSNRAMWFPRRSPARNVYPSDNANDPTQNEGAEEITPEEELQHFFRKFSLGCWFSQLKILIFCFILMMSTQIYEGNLNIAVYTYLSLNAIFILYYGWGVKIAKTDSEKFRYFLKEVESLSLMVWVLTLGILPHTIHTTSVNIFCGSIYIVVYALEIISEFQENPPRFVKYINKIKKSVALLRACIVLQLVIALIQVNLSTPMTWFVGFFPIYILTLGILCCTVVIIKSIFITNRDRFWESDTSQKAKGIIWVLGNLFALQFILLYGTIPASFVIEDDSSSQERPYLALFIIIIAWCIVSLISVKFTEGGILEVLKILAGIAKPVRNDGIKYMIKVSDTYFKTATKQDVNLLKSEKVQPAVVGDEEANLRSQQTNVGKCLICCQNSPNGVFMGCGHGGICYECGKDIMSTQKECHMCRTNISSLLKMRIKKKKMFYEVLQEFKIKNDPGIKVEVEVEV